MRLRKAGEAPDRVVPKVHPDHSAVAVNQRRQIAVGLTGEEAAEAEAEFGHLEVLARGHR